MKLRCSDGIVREFVLSRDNLVSGFLIAEYREYGETFGKYIGRDLLKSIFRIRNGYETSEIDIQIIVA